MKKLPLIAILLFAACGAREQNSQQQQSAISKDFIQEVLTAKANPIQLQKELTLTGKVTADPNKTISYSPLVSGVIVKSHFGLGDRVHRGQTMLDIRSSELSALQSELTIARRNLQSAESMFQDKLISETELIQARSNVEKWEADMSLYGQNMGNGIFSIKAHISGYVIQKHGNAGSTVSADSEPLFSIADLSTVWVEANVYAGNLQLVREGQPVEITSVAYPQEVFKGNIDFISHVFDPQDKALKARIVMPNPQLKLKPLMTVSVKLLNKSTDKMIAVPSQAVIFDQNSHFVVTANPDFAIRPIVPYDHHNGFTYISEGLEPNEEVVITNQLLIYNQLKGK